MSEKDTTERLPLVLDLSFHTGDFVTRRTDKDGSAGIVTGVIVRATAMIYLVTWESVGEKEHYDYELRMSEEPKET